MGLSKLGVTMQISERFTALKQVIGIGLITLALAGCASQGSVEQSNTLGQAIPGSAEDLRQNVGDRVFFDFDSYALSPAAQATLERQAQWLKQYANVKVVVEGHCDERGTREYNLALGARRANAAKNYLVSLGVTPTRVETISYGKERPEELGSNESAWSLNRRSVTVVTSGASS